MTVAQAPLHTNGTAVDRKYVYTRERSTAKLLADSYIHVARHQGLHYACSRVYTIHVEATGRARPGVCLWARDVSSQAHAKARRGAFLRGHLRHFELRDHAHKSCTRTRVLKHSQNRFFEDLFLQRVSSLQKKAVLHFFIAYRLRISDDRAKDVGAR